MIRLRSLGVLLAILALSACTVFDPYQRPGVWNVTGAVNHNVAVQVANPADLISGQADAMSEGAFGQSALDNITKLESNQGSGSSTSSAGSGTSASSGTQ
jgi:hypothetical protein